MRNQTGFMGGVLLRGMATRLQEGVGPEGVSKCAAKKLCA
jgi:hypothetical protein